MVGRGFSYLWRNTELGYEDENTLLIGGRSSFSDWTWLFPLLLTMQGLLVISKSFSYLEIEDLFWAFCIRETVGMPP